MIFLDSDALIGFLRGTPEMAALLAKNKTELFAIPSPVLFEVYYGIFFPQISPRFSQNKKLLDRLAKEHKRLIQFLNDVNIFDMNILSIKRSAKISAELDSQGKHIGEFNSLIAGIVLEYGYDTIVTNNTKHYENVPNLTILNF